MSNDKIQAVGVNIAEKATMIWNVADMLRGPFKPHEYGLVILPMTVVKRFHDCLLPTHEAVLAQYEKVKKLAVIDGFLTKASGYQFYNTSKFTFEKLLADPDNIEANFRDYLAGFSPNVQDVLSKFDFDNIIKRNSMNVIIGSVGISHYFGCVSPVYYVFKETENADLRFISYIFSTVGFQKELRKYAKGIMKIRLRISVSDTLRRVVPLPKLEEQQRIADYLDHECAEIDAVLDKTSKKLPLSSAALVCGYTGLLHQYSDCGGVFCPLFTTTTVKRVRFGKCSGNFFVFPVCSLQQSGGVVCQRFLKMGAKKAVNLFKIYCLSAAVMGGGIKLSAVFQMELICNRFLSAFQFLFCNLP